MASQALIDWNGPRTARLDEIVDLRRRAVGDGRGRKWGTRELNKLIATKMAAEFQGFARDLHEQCTAVLVQAIGASDVVRSVISGAIETNLKLNSGNANPGTLGSDFKRLGVDLVDALKQVDGRNVGRLWKLDVLNELRNGIAHEEASQIYLAERRLRSPQGTAFGQIPQNVAHSPLIKRDNDGFLSALTALASSMDRVMATHLSTLLDEPEPW